MLHLRRNIFLKTKPLFSFFHSHSNSHSHSRSHQHRSIFSTAYLEDSLTENIRVVFSRKGTAPPPLITYECFTLRRFADLMEFGRRTGVLKKVTENPGFENADVQKLEDNSKKHEAILRYLGGLDDSGENIRFSQKQEAAKHCNCTMADVDLALFKFTWAKEEQKKLEKKTDERKPGPKGLAEAREMMGQETLGPLDVSRSNQE